MRSNPLPFLTVLALLLAGCADSRLASEPSSAERRESFKIVETFACPYPESRGVLTVRADGAATLWIKDGLPDQPSGKSDRRKKKLSESDMRELARLIGASPYRSFPERAEAWPPRYDRTDPCDHGLEIVVDGVSKRTSYRDGNAPKSLEDLVKAIDAVLNRADWQPDDYPGER